MWQLIIAVAILVGEYIYHYARTPDAPAWSPDVGIPLITVDTPVPLLYGRYRVTSPILSYTSPVYAREITADNDFFGYEYFIDMMFVIGIPFENGANTIYGMWISDLIVPQEASFVSGHPELSGLLMADLTGNGHFEDANGTGVRLISNYPPGNATATDQGCVEYLNGNSTQTLIDPVSNSATTRAGQYMSAGSNILIGTTDELWNYGLSNIPDRNQIPGYRGYLSAFLWSTFGASHWTVGLDPQVNAYSFEVSTYPSSQLGLGAVGIDCNPIEVIYDLLTGGMGKLGLDPSTIDTASFIAAGLVLKAENHGFSRSFDQEASVADMLAEICKQIDAVMFEDPTTGTMKIKLIRADYDTATLPIINPDNCEELQNFAADGWSDIINRVVVTFTDRTSDYKPGNAVAFNQANAVGQDGQVNNLAVTLPGITSQELADSVAARLLANASRPLMKCRAIVNRSFMRLRLGDVVKLNWPEANIANIVMRVSNAVLGTIESGQIQLDLVQDAFYVHRNLPPQSSVAQTIIANTQFGP